MPRAARSCTGSRVMSWPWCSTRPLSGAKKPVITLHRVVLPAPFGPMIPTISHSEMATEMSRLACTPPNRMDTSTVSRTDIGDLHLLEPAVVEVEAAPAEPADDGPQLLADAAGEHGEVEQQEQRPDDQRGDLGREVARRGGGG